MTMSHLLYPSAAPYAPASLAGSSITCSQGSLVNGGEEITTIFVVGFPEDIQEREFQNMFLFCQGFEAATLKVPSTATTAASATMISTTPTASLTATAEEESRKQVIGFAKFRTRSEALEARDLLSGKKVDMEKGSILKAEMAKKNLHVKRSLSFSGTSGFDSSCYFPALQNHNQHQQQQQQPSMTNYGMHLRPYSVGAGRFRETSSGSYPSSISSGGVAFDSQAFSPMMDASYHQQDLQGANMLHCNQQETYAAPSDITMIGSVSASTGIASAQWISADKENAGAGNYIGTIGERRDSRASRNGCLVMDTSEAPDIVGYAAPSPLLGPSPIFSGGAPSSVQQQQYPHHQHSHSHHNNNQLQQQQHQHQLQLPSTAGPSSRMPSAPGSGAATPKISSYLKLEMSNSYSNGFESALYHNLEAHFSDFGRPKIQSSLVSNSSHATNGQSTIVTMGHSNPVHHTNSTAHHSTTHHSVNHTTNSFVAAPFVAANNKSLAYQMPKPVLSDQNNPPCNTLYVGNLPVNASEDELRTIFVQYPGYKRLSFRQKANGPMCFVEFENSDYAASAMNDLYGHMLTNSTKGTRYIRRRFLFIIMMLARWHPFELLEEPSGRPLEQRP